MAKKNLGSELKRYEVITQEDTETGDVLLPIPPGLLAQLGWKEGDNIEFGLDAQGRYILTKTD
jgi:hypothetical protein